MIFLAICALVVLCCMPTLCYKAVAKVAESRDRRERNLEQTKRDIMYALRAEQPAQPICGCNHHLALHKDQGPCVKVLDRTRIHPEGRLILPPKPVNKRLTDSGRYYETKADKRYWNPNTEAWEEIIASEEVNAWVAECNRLRAAWMTQSTEIITTCECPGYVGPDYYPGIVS